MQTQTWRWVGWGGGAAGMGLNFGDTTQTRLTKKKKKRKTKQAWLLALTPIPSSVGWETARLLNLHHSKAQSMEEGPFVENCQLRSGQQARSPHVKSAYLGCHLDMTGPQGQGRGVKLLTTLNVSLVLLYSERHAEGLTSRTVAKVTLPHSTPGNFPHSLTVCMIYGRIHCAFCTQT